MTNKDYIGPDKEPNKPKLRQNGAIVSPFAKVQHIPPNVHEAREDARKRVFETVATLLENMGVDEYVLIIGKHDESKSIFDVQSISSDHVSEQMIQVLLATIATIRDENGHTGDHSKGGE